ncbi:MAG: UvrD-helicase domain-containing protein, partial [Micrococcus sp.]|nr:UvrD-helicase domain-containing protein [Micrococcus sp.]
MSSPDVDDAAPQVRLHGVRGALSGPVTFTAEQEAVLGREPGHGPVLVVGGPGTGRSTLAVELVARRLEAGLDPHRVLVLAPTRRAAATLREQLGARLSAAGRDTRAATPVRTWSSYAFDLLRRARLHGPLSHLEHAPRLLSGAEQDTVIAELIEGLTASVGAVTMWPEDLRPALPTRGFRQEVRELVDRMSELGLEPGWLQAAGRQHGRPEWEAAAVLIQDYRDRLDLGMAEAFDPAGLIAAAVELLRVGAPPASDDARAGSATPGGDAPSAPPTMSVGEEFAAAERAHWQLIVVDDLQEASPAMHDLLRVLVTDVDCVLTASPDTTVQGFRGARPDLVHTYPDVLGGAAGARDSQQRVHVLTQGHRLGPKVLADWQRIAARIGTPSAAIVRARTELTPAAPRGGTEAVEPSAPDDAPRAEPSPATAVPTTAVLASREAELQFVLQEVLRIHHEDQVPLAEIAVLARSGTHVQELARFLEGESVPVHRDATGTVLKDQPAVAPLLSLLRTVTGIAAALERAQDARED